MTNPLSTEEGKIPLHTKLVQGATSEMREEPGDESVVRLDWSRSFQRDMEDFGRNNNYLSRTECEVVVMHYAVKEANDIKEESPLRWAKSIDSLHDTIKDRTEQYRRAGSEIDRFMDAVGGLSLSVDDKVEYKPAIGRKTTRKLSTEKNYTGVTKKAMIKIGVSKLILQNPDMFRRNTVRQAERANEDAKRWFDNSWQTADSVIRGIGQELNEAARKENLFVKDYKNQMKFIQSNHPELYEKLKEPFDGDPVV